MVQLYEIKKKNREIKYHVERKKDNRIQHAVFLILFKLFFEVHSSSSKYSQRFFALWFILLDFFLYYVSLCDFIAFCFQPWLLRLSWLVTRNFLLFFSYLKHLIWKSCEIHEKLYEYWSSLLAKWYIRAGWQ